MRPGYLAKNGFSWRGGSEPGSSARLVQKPGPENALGRIKFLFPNHHAVYLHDTPQRKLFGRSQRSLSHGCVRVEKPRRWRSRCSATRAGTSGGWTPRSPRARRSASQLDEPVPVFLDYRTAFVDEQGRLNLRPDLYGHDRNGITVFKGKGLPPEPVIAQEALPAPIITRPGLPLVPASTLPRPAS